MKKMIAMVCVAAAALVVAGVSFANHEYTGHAAVVVISKGDAGAGPGGNVACPSNTIKGPKLDPGSNYSDAYLTVSNYDGKTFDWAFTALGNSSSGYDMAVVIVKGGPASAVYTYDYVNNPAFDDKDSGLSAPTNPNNGKDYGISHIQFCFDPKGGGDN
jgi:hypothetical protein